MKLLEGAQFAWHAQESQIWRHKGADPVVQPSCNFWRGIPNVTDRALPVSLLCSSCFSCCKLQLPCSQISACCLIVPTYLSALSFCPVGLGSCYSPPEAGLFLPFPLFESLSLPWPLQTLIPSTWILFSMGIQFRKQIKIQLGGQGEEVEETK